MHISAGAQLPGFESWFCYFLAVLCLVAQSCPTVCNPVDCSPPGSSVHGDFPGKNTGVGCHALLQRIFPTQRSNPGLLHCRRILYHLSHQGSPWILEWIAYPFSRGSSRPRSWTHYVTSLCLCFLFCKPELIHRVVKIKRVSTDKELAAGWRCSSLLQLYLSPLKKSFLIFIESPSVFLVHLNLIFWMLFCRIRKAIPKRYSLQGQVTMRKPK